MIDPGPTRMVMIHSGKYDFAEIELDRAVHLVAPNNVGKTTLIAALQFLYVDQARHMDFAYDLPATRRYYFPDPYAYLLFECATPKGLQVLGVHGQGPTQGFQYERFRYTGQLDVADFLDDERRPRRWEEVTARLASADRDFALVQPRDLPGLLTGVGGRRAHAASFAVVPVRQRNGYDRFRRLFTHLLKLGKLRQEDLKQVLIETWEPDLVQREVDLEGGFRSQFDEVRKQREQVDALITLVPHIERALDNAAERDQHRAVLPSLWATLEATATSELEGLAARIDAARERIRASEELREASRHEADTRQQEATEQRQRLAVVDRELVKLDEQAERFRSWQPAFEDAAIERLTEQVAELEHQLRSARHESLSRAERDLASARRERAEAGRRLEQVARLVVTAAREHVEDESLAHAFALLNPELLGAVVGDGISIDDLDAAMQAVRRAATRATDGSASLAGVTLATGALRPADVARYGDPEALRAQIVERERDIERLTALVQALRDEEALKVRLVDTRKELEQCTAARIAFRAYREAETLRPGWEQERAEAREAAERAEVARDAARRDVDTHREARDAAEREVSSLRDRESRLGAELGGLEPPHWEHEAAEPLGSDASLEELIRRYRGLAREEGEAHQAVQQALGEVERIAYDQYAGENEAETLVLLREAHEALPERQRSLQELWQSLVVGLKSAFKSLGEDLDRLHSRLDELNRSLSRTSVSNLARLALKLERNRELGRYVRDVQHNEATPLFGSAVEAERALERIGELLRRRSRIRLEDMFDLHFEVTTPDGSTRRYPHLDRIESNGTTTTIKVLVSLHLLRALLTDQRVRVPFFLDEVASLDRRNLRGIVEAAAGLGFCPILASPEASDAAEVLYYLREGPNGRIVLDPDSPARIELRRSSEEG